MGYDLRRAHRGEERERGLGERNVCEVERNESLVITIADMSIRCIERIQKQNSGQSSDFAEGECVQQACTKRKEPASRTRMGEANLADNGPRVLLSSPLNQVNLGEHSLGHLSRSSLASRDHDVPSLVPHSLHGAHNGRRARAEHL